MKIECKPKEGRFGVLSISIDEEPWRDIHQVIYGRQPRFPKCETEEALIEYLQKKEYEGARQYALKRLAKYNQPSSQLKKALKEKLVSNQTLEKVIAECKNMGFLNDNEWLMNFIRQEILRGTGPQQIIRKLLSKGIDFDSSQKAVENMLSDETQDQQIAKLLSTRYRTRNLEDYKERSKVIAALLRKGFSLDSIHQAFK